MEKYNHKVNKFMVSLANAIRDCKRKGKIENANKLERIRNFLPDHSVMAVLMAEELGVDKDIVTMISDTFGVLSFGDQEYKKEKVVDN